MCDQTEVVYNAGDVVWVKLSRIWWPAQVEDQDEMDEEGPSTSNRPLAIVKFFDEDCYETVTNRNQIYMYNCRNKDEFIKKGLCLFRESQTVTKRDIPTSISKFPIDVQIAERLTNGNPLIIDDPKFLPEERSEVSFQEMLGFTPKRTNKTATNHSSTSSRADRGNKTKQTTYKHFNNASYKKPSKQHESFIRIQKSDPSCLTKIIKCGECEHFTSSRFLAELHTRAHITHDEHRNPLPDNVDLRPAAYNFCPTLKIPESSVQKRKSAGETSAKRKRQTNTPNSSNSTPAKKRVKKSLVKEEKQATAKIESPKTELLRDNLLKDWDDDQDEPIDIPVIENKEGESSCNNISTPVSKEQNLAKTQPEKSCFDFEDNEDSLDLDKNLKFGKKLPRVISGKKTFKDEERPQDDLLQEVNELLEETSVPTLPEVPHLPTLKPETSKSFQQEQLDNLKSKFCKGSNIGVDEPSPSPMNLFSPKKKSDERQKPKAQHLMENQLKKKDQCRSGQAEGDKIHSKLEMGNIKPQNSKNCDDPFKMKPPDDCKSSVGKSSNSISASASAGSASLCESASKHSESVSSPSASASSFSLSQTSVLVTKSASSETTSAPTVITTSFSVPLTSSVSTPSSSVSTASSSVSTASSSVSTASSSVSTASSSVSTLPSSVSTAPSSESKTTSSVSTASSSVSTVPSSESTANSSESTANSSESTTTSSVSTTASSVSTTASSVSTTSSSVPLTPSVSTTSSSVSTTASSVSTTSSCVSTTSSSVSTTSSSVSTASSSVHAASSVSTASSYLSSPSKTANSSSIASTFPSIAANSTSVTTTSPAIGANSSSITTNSPSITGSTSSIKGSASSIKVKGSVSSIKGSVSSIKGSDSSIKGSDSSIKGSDSSIKDSGSSIKDNASSVPASSSSGTACSASDFSSSVTLTTTSASSSSFLEPIPKKNISVSQIDTLESANASGIRIVKLEQAETINEKLPRTKENNTGNEDQDNVPTSENLQNKLSQPPVGEEQKNILVNSSTDVETEEATKVDIKLPETCKTRSKTEASNSIYSGISIGNVHPNADSAAVQDNLAKEPKSDIHSSTKCNAISIVDAEIICGTSDTNEIAIKNETSKSDTKHANNSDANKIIKIKSEKPATDSIISSPDTRINSLAIDPSAMLDINNMQFLLEEDITPQMKPLEDTKKSNGPAVKNYTIELKSAGNAILRGDLGYANGKQVFPVPGKNMKRLRKKIANAKLVSNENKVNTNANHSYVVLPTSNQLSYSSVQIADQNTEVNNQKIIYLTPEGSVNGQTIAVTAPANEPDEQILNLNSGLGTISIPARLINPMSIRKPQTVTTKLVINKSHGTIVTPSSRQPLQLPKVHNLLTQSGNKQIIVTNQRKSVIGPSTVKLVPTQMSLGSLQRHTLPSTSGMRVATPKTQSQQLGSKNLPTKTTVVRPTQVPQVRRPPITKTRQSPLILQRKPLAKQQVPKSITVPATQLPKTINLPVSQLSKSVTLPLGQLATPTQQRTPELFQIQNIDGEMVCVVDSSYNNQIVSVEEPESNIFIEGGNKLIYVDNIAQLNVASSVTTSSTPAPSQDILAKALANTQLLQTEANESMDNSTIFPDQSYPSAPLTLSNNVLETSLTLNQPIMATQEVPSSVSHGALSQISSIASVVTDGNKRIDIQPSMPLLTDDMEQTLYVPSSTSNQLTIQVLNENDPPTIVDTSNIIFTSDRLSESNGNKSSEELEIDSTIESETVVYTTEASAEGEKNDGCPTINEEISTSEDIIIEHVDELK